MEAEETGFLLKAEEENLASSVRSLDKDAAGVWVCVCVCAHRQVS